jgi:hypothetical protein
VRQFPYGTARALLAFRDPGDRSELAMVGALMWAEHIDNTRTIANFAKAFAKGSSGAKSGKRSGIRRKRR